MKHQRRGPSSSLLLKNKRSKRVLRKVVKARQSEKRVEAKNKLTNISKK